jgi:HemK-related putative methylase
MIYEPAEDSFLLEEQVKKFANGKVLDMGTGSGIQAAAAAKKKNVKSVLGVDIQKNVVDWCKKNVLSKKIKFQQSVLFKNIKKQRFDTIIFNPPYLPAEPNLKDITLSAGKKGFEIVEKFIKDAKGYLSDDGVILLLISSLTNQYQCEKIIRENLFEFEIISKQHIFFEDLFVYKIKKLEVLKELKKKRVAEIKYFTKGHRGLLLTGKYKGNKITIKTKLPESKAVARMANEAKWIKRLNKKGIGPKLAFEGKEYLAYYYVEGNLFPEFLKKAKKRNALAAARDVLMQCYEMDKIGVDKEEMHNPYKHILVKVRKPVLIDFERAHIVKSPKNVTQFLQYLSSSKVGLMDREKAIAVSKKYKKSITSQVLEGVL